MPIINMTSDLASVPADALNLRDVQAAYQTKFPLWTYESHNGLCLENRERNGYDDSDFYMVIWNPATQAPESITYASTRGWSYPCYGSSVDATPEVRAAYDAYNQRLYEAARARAAAEEAARPAKGKMLRVVKGRKVPVGTVGLCVWIGDSGYGTRVGIRDAAGAVHYTAVTNVEADASLPVPEEAAQAARPATCCKRCGDANVAWVKSARTGRFYLIQWDGRSTKNPRNFHECAAVAAAR
jgi:hypothetical protein